MAKVTTKPTKAAPFEQTDGRADHQPDLVKKRTLVELMGGSPKARYSQGSEDEYKAFLKTLNLTDMHREAQGRGLIPISDRKVLEQRLVREYKKTSSKYFGTVVQEQQNGQLTEKARQILAAGR